MLVTYSMGKSPLNLHFPSSLGTSMSDWFTFATVFLRGACELCSSFPAGSQSSTVVSLPGLEARVWEGGMGRKQPYFSTAHRLVYSPLLFHLRRRDVHEICLLTFTLGNLSRHCPQQHLTSETLKSHPIQMQIKSFLTITVE